MELIAKPNGRPNGIALSPNGRILYVSNSDERNIRAYDLDSKGAASNERVLVSGIDGIPDGLRPMKRAISIWRQTRLRSTRRKESRWDRSRPARLRPIARSAMQICRAVHHRAKLPVSNPAGCEGDVVLILMTIAVIRRARFSELER